MVNINELVSGDETIARYASTNYAIGTCECIVPKDVSIEQIDVSGCLEDTLRRILNAGGTEEDIALIMGAYKPTGEQRKELECTEIDLGFVIPGLLISFKLGGDDECLKN